jgi:Zn-dependent protease
MALLPLLRLANIYWAFFNLMPVSPLDGYGIVRNFLRMFLNERTAFTIAIWTSMIVGLLLALASLALKQFFLVVLLLWYVRSSYMQWQFFRSIDRTND